MQETQSLAPSFNPAAALPLSSSAQRLARQVSILSSPPLLGLLSLTLLGFALASVNAWVWIIFYVVATILMPSAYILHLVRRGLVSDFHMQRRGERSKPLFVFFFLSLLTLLVFHLVNAPRIFTALGTAGLIQSLGFLLITEKWKISGHSAGAAVFFMYLWGYTEPLPPPR